ncbi:MAG: hypothetical protein K6F84_00555 [Lachnospiraceae bacterium]|nr:hypothetical protein [Lachnospiraceae bacterium]
MSKYCYQKFLLNCEYDDVDLNHIQTYQDNLEFVPELGENNTIFDVGGEIVRKVKLSDIDVSVDTIEDWEAFLGKMTGVDEIVIIQDMCDSANKVIVDYRIATLKAYIYRMKSVLKDLEIYFAHEVSEYKMPI